MTAVAPARRETRARTTWAEVESGFHVGNRAGQYIGCVDRTDAGRFVAFDGHSTALGVFDSLTSARASVETASRRGVGESPRTAPIAAMLGIVAGVLLVAAAALTVPW